MLGAPQVRGRWAKVANSTAAQWRRGQQSGAAPAEGRWTRGYSFLSADMVPGGLQELLGRLPLGRGSCHLPAGLQLVVLTLLLSGKS